LLLEFEHCGLIIEFERPSTDKHEPSQSPGIGIRYEFNASGDAEVNALLVKDTARLFENPPKNNDFA
jgi:hypothetical protein